MAAKPYTIAVPDEALEKLSQRLALNTFPDQLEAEEPWDLGTPVAEVKRLANYWRSGFEWRKAEAQMNELPNFMTTIDVEGFGGIDIHCSLSDTISGGFFPVPVTDWPSSRASSQYRQDSNSSIVFSWM